MMYPLRVSLTAPDLLSVVRAVAATGRFVGEPNRLEVDHEPVNIATWRDAWERGRQIVTAGWGGGYADAGWEGGPEVRVDLEVRRRVFVAVDEFWGTPEELVAWLGQVPFEVASFNSLIQLKEGEEQTSDYINLEAWHQRLASAVAFRGCGHDRLVSRRWLAHGPWKVFGGEPDVSLVLFHDLDVDSSIAMAQAAKARRRMGETDEGGYIPSKYQVQHEISGLLDRETATLEIVVHGREVSQREMLDACATRLARRDDPASPIRTIAYVFIDEAAARAYLHELWLRELQCWYVDKRGKHRLDADYAPAPQPSPA